MSGRRERWNGSDRANSAGGAAGVAGCSTRAPAGRSAPTIPISGGLNRRAGRQGLPGHRGRRPDQLGAHRLADVDDLRAGLLRGRDDADVDAALRPGALRLRAARLAAPVRRDDRRRHPDQQDGAGAAQGLRPDAGAALRDLHGLAAPMAAAITIIPMRWCAAATASCRWTSMCPAARRPPRRWSTASCCCRGKSAAPARSSADDDRRSGSKPSASRGGDARRRR